MQTLLLVNGPNLGTLGVRKPDVYGRKTLAQVEAEVRALAASADWECVCFQSNHEGELIDFIERHREASAMVLNPGALMVAGWSLRDALESFAAPWIEVHISNVWAREPFRHASVVSGLAYGVVAGLGTEGYLVASQVFLKGGTMQ